MTDKICEAFDAWWKENGIERATFAEKSAARKGYQARDRELRTALTTARDALCLPCDRWNKTQFKIVQNAIAAMSYW